MFGLIKQVSVTLLSFGGSLASMANVIDHEKCISLNSQPLLSRSFLIVLNSGEHNQGLHYYPFIINLGKCNRSSNTLDDPSARKCNLNKTEEVISSSFNMITRINESKILAKSNQSKCKFDGRKCNSNQKMKNNKCRCECKNTRKH